MEFHRQYEDITFDFDCQCKVHVKNGRILVICAVFSAVIESSF